MKYCTKCGNAIDDNAAVCPICGETQKTEGSQNQSGTYSDFHSVKEKGPVGTAIASFIIGIISLVLCNTVIGPIVGLILGIVGTKQYNPARNTSTWMGVWGIVLNALSIIALIVFIAVVIYLYSTGQLEPDIDIVN